VGAKVYKKYQSEYSTLNAHYKGALEKHSIIVMAKVYAELVSPNCGVKNCFKGSKYQPSQEVVDTIQKLTYNSKKYVDDNFNFWLEKRVLTKVEDTTNYQKNMNNYEKVLMNGGFSEYANCVAKKRDIELENSDKIKEKQSLIGDILNFQKVNVKLLGYQDLESQLKVGNALLVKLETFKEYLYQDYAEYYDIVSGVNYNIQSCIDEIKNTMNTIYDNVYNIETSNDVSNVLTNIDSVLKYDLNHNDVEYFKEVQSYLVSVQKDITAFEKNNFKLLDREHLTNEYNTLLQKYQGSEYNITNVIDSTYNTILAVIDQHNTKWKETYLSTFDYLNASIDSLIKWQKSTTLLPKYLTDEVKNSYENIALHVKERLSQNNVDTAIQMFNNLNESEKKEFLARIIIN
jgi:hypothetical protein